MSLYSLYLSEVASTDTVSARALETACEALKALQGRSGGAFTPDLALGNAMTTAAGNSKGARQLSQ